MKSCLALFVAVCLFLSSCSVAPTKQAEPINVKVPPIVVYDIKPEIKVKLDIPPIVVEKDLACLSNGIYYEAGNQNDRGKLAVGFVIINRTLSPHYPHTICGVIKQQAKIAGKTFCQFNWYCNNGEHKIQYPPDNEAFKQSKRLASLILQNQIDNWMPHVIAFHILGINPNWTRRSKITVFATYGNHIFYKENTT